MSEPDILFREEERRKKMAQTGKVGGVIVCLKEWGGLFELAGVEWLGYETGISCLVTTGLKIRY